MNAASLPFQFDPGIMECQRGKFPHGMLYPGGNDKILRLVMLQHQPHALHIILRIAPVPLRIQITQVELVLNTTGDPSGCQCDLTGHKVLSAALRFMVKQDTIHCEHIVCIPVFLHDPEAVLFCHRIGAVGMERCILVLRHFFHSSVQFGSRCLIDAAGLGQSYDTYRL